MGKCFSALGKKKKKIAVCQLMDGEEQKKKNCSRSSFGKCSLGNQGSSFFESITISVLD